MKKEQDDWDQYIDGVLFGYRTAVQKSTKKSGDASLVRYDYSWTWDLYFYQRFVGS